MSCGPRFLRTSISSVVVTATSLDITNSPQILTLSFRATDTSEVKLTDLGKHGFYIGNNTYNFDNPYILISGTDKDGTYTATTTLSSTTHPPGTLFYQKEFRMLTIIIVTILDLIQII